VTVYDYNFNDDGVKTRAGLMLELPVELETLRFDSFAV
jgi:hypothetical protein